MRQHVEWILAKEILARTCIKMLKASHWENLRVFKH